VVENMSGLRCPHCGEAIDVFGSGGGQALADEMKVPFLGRVPLDPAIREAGDRGVPTVLSAADSDAARALADIADKVQDSLAALVG
jgi:hypothetical protein